jgi:hypothetical protein
MASLVLTATAAVLTVVRYEIVLTDDWVTREVRVSWRFGAAREHRMWLSANGAGRWWIDRDSPPRAGVLSAAAGVLVGLVDVDFGFSPATNTLPIRRLAPGIGQAVEVSAAWIRFPEMMAKPLPQSYV